MLFKNETELINYYESKSYDILGIFDYYVNIIDISESDGVEETVKINKFKDGSIKTY